ACSPACHSRASTRSSQRCATSSSSPRPSSTPTPIARLTSQRSQRCSNDAVMPLAPPLPGDSPAARGERWSRRRCRALRRGSPTLNRQGRATRAGEAGSGDTTPSTGNRALRIEEPLIFEIGRPEVTGIDLDEPAAFTPRLGALERTDPIGLPGLSEPETVRHYVRLSRNNYSIDSGVYPLGSCTMKHNPRLNESIARLPGFADIHPLQPLSTVPGALNVIATLAHWLAELTGMAAIALSPQAGAHAHLP